jgi:hypothetical protein
MNYWESAMKKIFTLFYFVINFLLTVSITAQEANYIKGELIVQFSEKIPIEEFVQSYSDIQMENIRMLSKRMNIWWVKYNPAGTDDNEIRFRVSRDTRVNIVQFNHRVTLRNSFEELANFPDDPQFSTQWALHNTGQSGGTPDADIDAPEAWDISTGGVTALGDSIVVAIVDGGCQLNHPDINYWYNWNEIPGNLIDDDGNGYIDDFRGWNAYNNNPNVPSDGHGTHVSGISGAHGNNSTGVSGVNWNVKIMPIAGASGDEATVVAAYAYALELRAQYNETNGTLGAFVVATNSSFGVDYGQPIDYPIWCAMYDSLGMQGILSCAATANLNIDIDIFGDIPTACPSDYMIAVTNTNRNDQKNSGAAYGLTTIDLGAPGTSILSTYPTSSYQTLTGTSMATPMVTGAIALLYSAADSTRIDFYKSNPSAGAIMFRDVLLNGVDTLPSLQGITVTGGRLNIFNAVIEISNPIVPVELISFNYEVVGENVVLSWITSTETNNYGFEIERNSSINEVNPDWDKIGFIPGKGTSTEINYYSFKDENLITGNYSYRLKQIDFDGTFNYSKMIEVNVETPLIFSLEQNYPNPFNPGTTINYSISSDGIITLIVYDILGNEVATLVSEYKSAGKYSADFNANHLSSGIYFYQLQSGSYSKILKMILMK